MFKSKSSELELGLVELTFFLVTFHSPKRTPSRSFAKVWFHSSLVLGMNAQEGWTHEGLILRTIDVVAKHYETVRYVVDQQTTTKQKSNLKTSL